MKKELRFEELENQMAVELPDRELMQTVIVGGGLVTVGVGNVNVDVDIPVTVEDNQLCVNVAAIDSQAFCEEQ